MASRAGVRLLPNAVTVLALCSGLSAVHFALNGRFDLCVAAIAAAAVFDALDGGLARLLDASSRIGAELDSLSDLVAFGVSPALLFYIWRLDGNRLGWVVALVFAVCMALRLARFNTLMDAEQRWPFAKEFFVGVPAPAAALVGGLPLVLWLQFGDGWWSTPLTVGLWALLAASLMVSRVPTISLKTARVPPRLVAPALVLVGLGFAVLVAAPFVLMAAVAVGYLLLLPYTVYRFEWLKRHPEAWDVPTRERRAIARAARSAGFFANRAILLDLSGLVIDRAELTQLVADLYARDIRIMGLEGADAGLSGLGLPPLVNGGRQAAPIEVVDPAAPRPEAKPAQETRPAPGAAALVVDQPVRSGQSIVHPDGDVIVIGSVASGAEVVAGGSVHIYGSLRGRAIAGSAGHPGARIFCRRFEAELIAIDGVYRTSDDGEPSLTGKPVQALLKGETIIMTGLE